MIYGDSRSLITLAASFHLQLPVKWFCATMELIHESFYRLQLHFPKALTTRFIHFTKLKNFAYEVRPFLQLM
jgi:hypothetical protein